MKRVAPGKKIVSIQTVLVLSVCVGVSNVGILREISDNYKLNCVTNLLPFESINEKLR